MTETIKMRRDAPLKPGGPTEADVHPGEVETWKHYGWTVAAEEAQSEAQPEAKAPKKPKPEK